MVWNWKSKNKLAWRALKNHFRDLPLEDLVTAGRSFPVTARVDLHAALVRIFDSRYPTRLLGFHSMYSHETLTLAHLLDADNSRVLIAPLQYDEVDMGAGTPARCLKYGLWLTQADDMPFVVLLAPAERYGRTSGTFLEVGVPPGERGLDLSRSFFDETERLINEAASYRGKVISLEQSDHYGGTAGAVKVHKLRSVVREEVVLPETTLQLLERNVTGFIEQREQLRAVGMSLKKGLLFYGPPGTGKTHTVHYLASQLPNHTTLLITAEQVGLLNEYFQLARFLQPALVVVEDVDLIARDRQSMRSACEESLLNRLLNEMDGLREEAAILFILTTNRPDQLEAALASRPGRVDQAIEFPLPDDEGRRKLIALYSRGVILPDEIINPLVRKTKGASAAFIKELMRRSAQYMMRTPNQKKLQLTNVEAALDEMLFSGGSLNRKLLGGNLESN
ncbi:MAG: AAA family ATPase [Verrucomicrobia subdivision 3 bacterium]|nr:AAA family ATPase [Limisphaerales bacterium]